MDTRIDLGLQFFQLVAQVEGGLAATIGVLGETAADESLKGRRSERLSL